MNLIQPILYFSLLFFIIFFLYIILYKSYFLSASKITTPDEALAELLEGNKKYNSFWHFITHANRKSVSLVQRPFAIVLSCSDSRVPTEIIFNQMGLGNLFIIRNAGNVVDNIVLGSIEFGINELKALIVIVLGHERCGAVTATIEKIINKNIIQTSRINNFYNGFRSFRIKLRKLNHSF